MRHLLPILILGLLLCGCATSGPDPDRIAVQFRYYREIVVVTPDGRGQGFRDVIVLPREGAMDLFKRAGLDVPPHIPRKAPTPGRMFD